MSKISFSFLLFCLLPLGLFSQNYEFLIGPKQEAPWHYRTRYATSFANMDVYQGLHEYNTDSEFSDDPNPEIVLGKKTNDFFIQLVDRSTSTPSAPVLYDHKTVDESGKSIQLYTHIYAAEKDRVILLGVGYFRKKEMSVFRKVVSFSGAVVEDWKPISVLGSVPAGMAGVTMEYEISEEGREGWQIKVRYKKQNYYLIREELFDLQPDFSLTQKYAVANFPKKWHQEVFSYSEGNHYYAFYHEYNQRAAEYLPPSWRFTSYDAAADKFLDDPASKIKIEGKILHRLPGIVADPKKGLWYIFGAYSDKGGLDPAADGTYCIAFDYKSGNVQSTRLFPFEENLRWIKSFHPRQVQRLEDGSFMALCPAESRNGRMGYVVMKLNPDGNLDWIRYACGTLKDESIQKTAGVVMAVFDPKEGFQIWSKTTEADMVARDFREADKGVKILLLNVRINPQGVRTAQQVLDFGQREELKAFRPYHIKGHVEGEFMFRFRLNKDSYTYGVMRVR